MTITAAEKNTRSTSISVGSALVLEHRDYAGRTFYSLEVSSPRDAKKVTRLEFTWSVDPEFRVAPEGSAPMPRVRVGRHASLETMPKYVQNAAAEAAQEIAEAEQARHGVVARTPEEDEAIGPYVTRGQHAEMTALHEMRLEDYDQELVVAILRAAVENGWATPDDLTEVENARDEALGELEEQKPQMEELESLRTAAEAVQEESWRFLAKFEPTGLRPEGLDAAHCEIVTDEARYLDEALSKLGTAI